MTIWRMRIAWWIPMATNTRTENMQYLLPFHGNSGCENGSERYVVFTLPVLLTLNIRMLV